jgi:hypothetical protein
MRPRHRQLEAAACPFAPGRATPRQEALISLIDGDALVSTVDQVRFVPVISRLWRVNTSRLVAAA